MPSLNFKHHPTARRRSRRGRRTRLLAAGCFLLLVVACATTAFGAGPRAQVVRSLRHAQQYACTSTAGPNGTAEDYSPIGNGVSAVNLWNVRSSSGSIVRCYDSNGLTTTITLSNVVQDGPGPSGYPELAYGFGLTDRPFCAGLQPCATEPFPLPVAKLDDTYSVSTSYKLDSTSLPYDFIYDLWLERAPTAAGPVSCTASDAPPSCPQRGDIELLIVLDHRRIPRCDSSTSTVSEPLTTGGVTRPSRWAMCTIAGGTEATSVAMFLDSPSGRRAATLGLPLKRFVSAAIAYLGPGYRQTYDLMGVELGGEFDSCAVAACTASWGWRVSDLSLTAPGGTTQLVGN